MAIELVSLDISRPSTVIMRDAGLPEVPIPSTFKKSPNDQESDVIESSFKLRGENRLETSAVFGNTLGVNRSETSLPVYNEFHVIGAIDTGII